MGIKGLTQLIADNVPAAIREHDMGHYTGRKVAIDASMSIYQFMIAVRSGPDGGGMLTNEDGEVTSHLQGVFHRTIRLIQNGLKPVYVFDGKPPELKAGELVKRREKREEAEAQLAKAQEDGDNEMIEKLSKRTVRVTKEHNEECKTLLTLMGVPYIDAPSEAEGQCAALAAAGLVYGAASEDTDTLTFGAPLLLRKLTFSAARKEPVMEIDLNMILQGLNLTMDQFIDMCILCGCDYTDKIGGIGPTRALEFIRKHGSIEEILQHLDPKKYTVPENFLYAEARSMFKNIEVLSDEEAKEQLKWTDPDKEGLIEYLVNKKGFEQSRVESGIKKLMDNRGKRQQTHLDAFFGRPTITVNAKKRKKESDAKKAAKRKKLNSKKKARGRK